MDRNLIGLEKAFFQDIDVPEIVQLKADLAFSRIRTEQDGRETAMKKEKPMKRKTFIKLMAGAAACLAVAASATKGSFRNQTAGRKADMPADCRKEAADSTVLSAMDNMFTMHVAAAELTKDHPVAIQASGNDAAIDGKLSDSWVLSGDEDDGSISYCIGLPLSCTGNNIEKITYSINNGAFHVVQPKDGGIIADGQLFGRELRTGSIGGDFNVENGGKPSRDYETVLYRSFTLDYQKQSDPYTWISICNEVLDSQEAFGLIFGNGEYDAEKSCKGLQMVLGDTAITCTVQYTDGTEQSSDILVSAKVMTYAEAGRESGSGNQDDRSEFITFELQ